MKPLLLCVCLLISFISQAQQGECFDRKIFDIADYFAKGYDTMQKEATIYSESFVGCHIPDFEAVDMMGKRISAKELKGKILVLNFWFTRCAPCVREFNSLNKLSDEFAKDVVFISFASDRATLLDSFLRVKPLRFRMVAAADSVTKEVFKISIYPTNMIVGRDGRIVAMERHGQSDEGLANYDKIAPVLRRQIGLEKGLK